MKIDGGCHCGFITYEAEVDPEQVGLCNCTDCQVLSGSAFRVGVPVPASDFKLRSGEPKRYVKTAESGNKRAQMFCPECGTGIYTTAAEGPGADVYRIRVATARQRDELPPRRQTWLRSQQAWVPGLGSVPGTERQ